jgi:chromosome segregation ATPase
MKRHKDVLTKPKRATIERDLQRKANEAAHATRDLHQVRPKLEAAEAELKDLKVVYAALKEEHSLAVARAWNLAQKLSDLTVEHAALRAEYLEYRDRAIEDRKRLEALEKAGRELLEFLPSEATGRARFSKHARAAVAFRRALEEG